MNTASDFLQADGVTFAYGAAPVVRDVTLALRRGDMLALAGPNGSGKTTLLKLLSGILRPDVGTVTLNGIDIRRIPERQRARSVAVVPQQVEPRLAFTVEDVVTMGRTAYAHLFRPLTPSDRRAVREAMGATGLQHFAERSFNNLSGGEQQRVALAMALAQEAEFLLLDEPTVHLDLHHQHELLELLIRLHRERRIGVLAVMHDLNLSALYFERLAVMQSGSLVADGTPDNILGDDGHLAIFGTSLARTTHPQTGAVQVVLQRDERNRD